MRTVFTWLIAVFCVAGSLGVKQSATVVQAQGGWDDPICNEFRYTTSAPAVVVGDSLVVETHVNCPYSQLTGWGQVLVSGVGDLNYTVDASLLLPGSYTLMLEGGENPEAISISTPIVIEVVSPVPSGGSPYYGTVDNPNGCTQVSVELDPVYYAGEAGTAVGTSDCLSNWWMLYEEATGLVQNLGGSQVAVVLTSGEHRLCFVSSNGGDPLGADNICTTIVVSDRLQVAPVTESAAAFTPDTGAGLESRVATFTPVQQRSDQSLEGLVYHHRLAVLMQELAAIFAAIP